MWADAVAGITESVFPILFERMEGERSFIGVSGTGFFVDDRGLFMTAEHIIANAPAGSRHCYYGKLPDQICQPVEIERVASDPTRDLYLGRVPRDYLSSVEFADDTVRPGNSVCMSGYPLAVPWLPGRGLAGNVRRYWQPTFVVDGAEVVIGQRTYDGYIVQHTCFRGMSGGPVFDLAGRVRGMVAASLTRTIPDTAGYPTVVKNGIVIDVEHMRGFIEAAQD